MKILHAILGFRSRIGGAERQANLLAQEPTSYGRTVTVSTRGSLGYISSDPIATQRCLTNKFLSPVVSLSICQFKKVMSLNVMLHNFSGSYR